MAEYGYQDVTISMLGRVVARARGVKYKETSSTTNIPVLGSANAVDNGKGASAYTGELMILQSEFDALCAGLPRGKTPTSLAPFNVTVVYQKEGDATIWTDVLNNVRITEWEKGFEAEDPFMEVTLPIVFTDVTLNA